MGPSDDALQDMGALSDTYRSSSTQLQDASPDMARTFKHLGSAHAVVQTEITSATFV